MTLTFCYLLLRDSLCIRSFAFTTIWKSDNYNVADSTQALKPKMYRSKSGFVINLGKAASLFWTCLPPSAPIMGSWSSTAVVLPAVLPAQTWIHGCMCAAVLPALSPAEHRMPHVCHMTRYKTSSKVSSAVFSPILPTQITHHMGYQQVVDTWTQLPSQEYHLFLPLYRYRLHHPS